MTKTAASAMSDRLLEEAATKYLRLQNAVRDGEETTELQLELEHWLQQDARHLSAYQNIQDGLIAVSRYRLAPEMLAVRRDALDAARRHQRQTVRIGLANTWKMAAAAALAALAVTGGWMFLHRDREVVYETAIGQTSLIFLPDASRVTLDGNSRVKVRYSSTLRAVQLLRGEAQFDVAKDATRPFRVTARDQSIVAHGTTFDVELIENQVLVTLLEGRISVTEAVSGMLPGRVSESTYDLTPGQELIARGGVVEIRRDINVEETASWHQGRLVFKDEALSTAVSRINRQSHLQISIDNDRIANLVINGVYTGDTDAFVDALTKYFPVRAVRVTEDAVHLVAAN